MKSTNDLLAIEGLQAIKHLLRFGIKIDSIYATDNGLELAHRICPGELKAITSHKNLIKVSASKLAALSSRKIPTQTIAFTSRANIEVSASRPQLILDNPKNLNNIGAIIRTCYGLGVQLAIVSSTIDSLHPVITRTSAGLNLISPPRVIKANQISWPMIGLDNNQPDCNFDQLSKNDFIEKTFILGSEREGLSPEVKLKTSTLAQIPIEEGVSSLSLPAVAAITAYSIANARSRAV